MAVKDVSAKFFRCTCFISCAAIIFLTDVNETDTNSSCDKYNHHTLAIYIKTHRYSYLYFEHYSPPMLPITSSKTVIN